MQFLVFHSRPTRCDCRQALRICMFLNAFQMCLTNTELKKKKIKHHCPQVFNFYQMKLLMDIAIIRNYNWLRKPAFNTQLLKYIAAWPDIYRCLALQKREIWTSAWVMFEVQLWNSKAFSWILMSGENQVVYVLHFSLTLVHCLEGNLSAGMAYRGSLDFSKNHGLQSQEL